MACADAAPQGEDQFMAERFVPQGPACVARPPSPAWVRSSACWARSTCSSVRGGTCCRGGWSPCWSGSRGLAPPGGRRRWNLRVRALVRVHDRRVLGKGAAGRSAVVLRPARAVRCCVRGAHRRGRQAALLLADCGILGDTTAPPGPAAGPRRCAVKVLPVARAGNHTVPPAMRLCLNPIAGDEMVGPSAWGVARVQRRMRRDRRSLLFQGYA